jgi:hypothetical protein
VPVPDRKAGREKDAKDPPEPMVEHDVVPRDDRRVEAEGFRTSLKVYLPSR